MKKFFVMLALAWGTVGAFAQNEADSVAAVNNAITLAKDVYPQKEEDGDLYHGLTRKLTFDRMIPPYGLEVTYGKTTHIIFPSSVRYVDLGSPNLIAGKADGAENVIRVKATVKDFREETNMSVITESGSFYTFNVKYAEEPLLLNIEMKDFIFVFQLGLNETMNDSLAICQEQFKEYWGQTLVNTLRALHDVKYRQSEEDEPEEDDCDDDDCHCHGHHHHD